MDPIFTAGQLGAISLVVVDYPNDIERYAIANSAGVAYVLLDPVPTGMIWRIERMTTFISDANGNLITNPPAGALFNLYKVDGGQVTPLPIKFRDGSQSPGLDVADESSPISVQQGLSVLPYWTGLAPGTVGNIAIQYQLLARLSGVTSS
jgi:hypothetical protein